MWILGALAACSGPSDPKGSSEPFTPPGAGEIELTTSDGVRLVADYYPQAEAGAPGLVLLHMIPPTYDRSTWPSAFVERLFELGFSVLVVDRRGAGESDGVAADAYEGPKGKLDVEACVSRLVADGYGPVSLIGASNGTTSMIDYTVWAPGQGLPQPAALGFMTGGAYTENQNPMSAVPEVPAVFTYSTAERAWSEDQRALDPGTWVFHEYPQGDHGTKMFEAAPQVVDDLAAFFAPFAR